MTWTYDDTLTTDKDKVRFYVGDTDTNNQLVSDEAIGAMLVEFEDVYQSAAAIADGLAVRFARSSSISVDGLTISGSDKAKAYRDLAANLRDRAATLPGGLGEPFVGGVSVAEMDSVASDTDRPTSIGSIDTWENTSS